MSCISAKVDVINCSVDLESIKFDVSINVDTEYFEKNITVTNLYTTFIESSINTYNLNISTSYSKPIDIGVSMICDISGGVPLYAEDGSLLTFEGYPIYVRKAKTKNYE